MRPNGFDPLIHVGCPTSFDTGQLPYTTNDGTEHFSTPGAADTHLLDSEPCTRSPKLALRCLAATCFISAIILILAFAIRATRAGEDFFFFGRGAWFGEAFAHRGPLPLGYQGRQYGKYSEAELWSVVRTASSRYNVPPELVWAIIDVESRFDHQAKSRAGALGLMQLMPGTAKELKVLDPFDAHQNIHGGTKYISDLLVRYNNQKEIALAAYNAGPGKVERYRGIPPYRETKQYVTKVMGLYKKNKASLRAAS